MAQLAEATLIKHVEFELQRRFAEVPAARIHDELRMALRRFDGAPVRTYVPVLLQKRVTDRLRGRRSGAASLRDR